jgi:hypothetical protein
MSRNIPVIFVSVNATKGSRDDLDRAHLHPQGEHRDELAAIRRDWRDRVRDAARLPRHR